MRGFVVAFIGLCAVVAGTGSAQAQNQLVNGDFEAAPLSGCGNHVNATVPSWTVLPGNQPNIVRVDGDATCNYRPSGTTNGPERDATLQAPGVWRQYMDIVGSNSFYQQFTARCAGTLTYSGWFSSRDGSGGKGTIAIHNGPGGTGPAISNGSTVTLASGATGDDWRQSTGSVSVSAGQQVSYVVTMDNDVNFDEAEATFISGPCGEPATACCPPVAANNALLEASFGMNQMPGENITQHYGLNFAPAGNFDNQMQLWAPFAINAYAAPGWTGAAIIMWADMNTDGPAPGIGAVNPNWAPTATDWATGTPVFNGWLRIWFSTPATWAIQSSALWDANLAKPGGNAHMEPNGRRYMTAISYLIWEYQGNTARPRRLCDGTLVSFRLNVSGRSAIAGGGKPQILAQDLRLKTPEIRKPTPDLAKLIARGAPKR